MYKIWGVIKILKKIIKIVALIVFLVSAGVLIKILVIDRYIVQKSNKEIRELYDSAFEDTELDSLEESQDKIQNKLKSLQEVNSDIIGWIKIEDTKINYPILMSRSEPEFYLYRDYKKQSSKYGSIFVDYVCKKGMDSQNVILHGHHMNDGEMFANLLKFSNPDFCKEHCVISIDTLSGRRKYKLMSVMKLNTLSSQGALFDYQIPSFTSDKFFDFSKNVKSRSIIDIPVNVEKNYDKLLMMSTCSYEFEGFRTVVVWRMLRSGEDESVDTSLIKKAVNPVMPECWYKK